MSNNNSEQKRFYRIIASLWLGSGLAIIGDSAIYTVLPLYVGIVGISLSDAGTLMGVNRLVRLVTNSVFGYLVDFGNPKKIFVSSLFIGAVSYFLFGFCYGFTILFIARILWGIAWSGINIAGTSILLEETTVENRGKLIGLHYFWISVGHILGTVFGGVLSDKIGFQSTMAVNGFLALGGAIYVFIFLPGAKTHKKEKISFTNFKKNYSVKLDLTLLLYAVILGTSRFVFAFIASLISIITKEKISPFIVFIGISTLTGIIGGVKAGIETCINPIIGSVADKFKNRLYVVTITLLFGVAGLFIITLAPPYLTLLGLLLCTVPTGSINVLVRTLVGDHAVEKNSQGRSMGFVFTVGDLASAIGPVSAFRLLNHISLDTVYRCLSVILLALVAAIIAFLYKEKKSVSR
ncbi:MAG: MFS transporter [Spirochaetaceae bacterium]|nr:MFS transporter [Spirochaetaceae bacterium]